MYHVLKLNCIRLVNVKINLNKQYNYTDLDVLSIENNVSETNVIVINKTIQFYTYFCTTYLDLHVYWRYNFIF